MQVQKDNTRNNVPVVSTEMSNLTPFQRDGAVIHKKKCELECTMEKKQAEAIQRRQKNERNKQKRRRSVLQADTFKFPNSQTE